MLLNFNSHQNRSKNVYTKNFPSKKPLCSTLKKIAKNRRFGTQKSGFDPMRKDFGYDEQMYLLPLIDR